MKKENQIIEVEEGKFCNYESKIKYIVKNDRFELQALNDEDSKIQYIINHFIMTDFDCKQLELYLQRHGNKGFFQMIEKAILS